MVTRVPIDLVIENLRGFIFDHRTEIIRVKENHVSLFLNPFQSKQGDGGLTSKYRCG